MMTPVVLGWLLYLVFLNTVATVGACWFFCFGDVILEVKAVRPMFQVPSSKFDEGL